uniref:Amidohydrolase 3 n=1 Tax=Solibacter usitatus (strain Ellin6076) TaxID=234267 RepID=Q01UR8_SOLUE
MRLRLAIALLFLRATAAAPATLAIVNARVWTGDPARPFAEAIATSGDRVLAVGSNAGIRALAAGTVIDGAGATLTPGFIDSHIHLLVFDRNRPYPPIFMRYLTTRRQVADRISAYAAKLPKGAWILGEDWTDALWAVQPPSRAWLDRIAPDHPVWLTRIEGASGIANSAALRAAGFGAQTPGLVGGGNMWRIEAAIIEPFRERDERIVEHAMDLLLRAGVTSAQHNNAWYDFLILRRLHQAGRRRIRVYDSPPLPAWERLRDYIREFGRGDAWMHWGGLKGFTVVTEPDYYRWVSGASSCGLQVMVHLGSEAELRTLLGVFLRVRREQHLADPRFRLEHAHDLPPDVIPLVAEARAIPSWQPALLAHFAARTAAGQLAPRNLFPARAVLDAGVKIAFGTDSSPAYSLVAPVQTLQIAMEHAMSLDQALRAHTLDAAYAEFAENEKGSLQAGKLADFVLFDRDLSRLPVHQIHEAKVRLTVVGGRIMYDSR